MRYLTLSLLSFIALSSNGQAGSNIKFTFVGCNEIEIEWTNGNGSDHVVFVREGSAISEVPIDSEYYTKDPVFGKGETIKGDNKHFCVYRGPDNKVTITGLKNLSKYSVAVFGYNTNSGYYDYKTDTFASNATTTKNIVAQFSISPLKQCQRGTNFQFNNTSHSDLSPLNFSWDFGDGKSSTDKQPLHSYVKPGIMNVKLIAMTKGCSVSITMKDTVFPHPVAKFDLDPGVLKNDSEQCFYKNKYTFINRTTILDIGEGIQSMRYEWYDMRDIFDPTAFANTFKADYHFPTSGKQTIKLVAVSNNGCRDSTYKNYHIRPRNIDTVKMKISPKYMALTNNEFTFTHTNPNIVEHKWVLSSKNDISFSDTLIGQTVKYSFKKLGLFYVTLLSLDKWGCLDAHRDSLYVNNDAGFSKPIDNSIFIYPNPSKTGVFHINNLPADASIIIYTILGKELLNYKLQQANSTINLEPYGAGTYILTISSLGKKLNYRLVVL